MKAEYKLPACVFGVLLFIISMNPLPVSAQYDDVSLETFYEELSPYGVWIDDPQYGKVWRPDVDQDEFRPYYSSGHWEMTSYGNTWVSDYNWGWAPFHYGRWYHAGRRGWLWIPGTQWGPAWVSWRSGGGYYGWAPLGPGININISIGRIPDFYWVFIPQRSIYYRSYPRYDRRRNINIYHNTVIINNTYVYNKHRYYSGPRAEEVRRVTRQPVTIHEVRNSRPSRYADNSNKRPEVSRNTRQQSNTAQAARPERSYDNSRNTYPARPGSSADRQRSGSVSSREQQKIPAASQRSSRTYDNQDIRSRESSQRQRPVISEQRQKMERPVQREVRPQSNTRQTRSSVKESSRQRSPQQSRSSSGRSDQSGRSQGRSSRTN